MLGCLEEAASAWRAPSDGRPADEAVPFPFRGSGSGRLEDRRWVWRAASAGTLPQGVGLGGATCVPHPASPWGVWPSSCLVMAGMRPEACLVLLHFFRGFEWVGALYCARAAFPEPCSCWHLPWGIFKASRSEPKPFQV